MRKFLVIALLLLATAPGVQAQDANRPDVLFISIDDLNDWVGVLGGHPQAKTPNIDALAARGMVFTNAHAVAAICNPSRTALMLGLRPSTTGVYENDPSWLDHEHLADLPTIPRYFRDHGYRTQGAGKIFHAHTYSGGAFAGYQDARAWDAYYPSFERQLPDEVGPPDRPANDNPINIRFDWSHVVTDDRAMGDGQVAAWISERLLESADRPRFTAAGIYRPHPPWYVPQAYFDAHPLPDIVLPTVPENDLDDVSEITREFTRGTFMPPLEIHEWMVEANRWAEGVQAYLASVTFADAMVGHILDALDRSGRADNTIIVLWSDHGWHLGEKLRWRKHTLWEESTRVPLIFVVPGVTTPGSRSDRTVSLLDLFPTLAELADIDVPGHLEGTSLAPLLNDPDAQWDRPAISTHLFGNHAVRSERYRYIRYNDSSEELYDHDADPNEWHNLADDPGYADVKAELANWLPAENAPDLRFSDEP